MTTAIELELTRRYSAPPAKVFEAWTSPEVLKRWWKAGPDFECPVAEVDLREGGRYRLAMQTPQGETHAVVGEYREIEAPRRLVYTWGWENAPADETVVEVEFRPVGDGTEVVLRHHGFTDEQERGKHEHGWNGVLESLERALRS